MKITDITVTRFRTQNCVHTDAVGHAHPGTQKDGSAALVTVFTDEGHEGYSLTAETYQTPRPGMPLPPPPVKGGGHKMGDAFADAILGILKPVLMGQDPLCREKIFYDIHLMQRSQNNGILLDHVIAHVDKALWDLAGRMAGLPIYKYLGGHRDKVLAYASTMCGDHIPGGLSTPEEYGEFAKKLVAEGYQAIKLHTWSHPDPKKDIAACAAVRKAVGDNVDLMLDCYHYYDRYAALEIGRAIQDLGFLWYEEPMDEYTPANYRWLKEKLDIPIIGPEVAKGNQYTRAEWILANNSDISRAGSGSCGGITPLVQIAHMCQCHGIPMEMHGTGAANLHVMGAMVIPGKYYERGMLHPMLNYNNTPPWLNAPIDGMDKQGYVHLPTAPGLGYDMNWDYINENKL